MGYGTYTDPIVRLAFGTGVAVIALTLLLLGQILLLRLRLILTERRRRAQIALWRPLLAEVVGGGEPPLPTLDPRNTLSFLSLWNHLHDTLRGEARDRLNRAARAAGVMEALFTLIRRGGRRERLIAAISFGRLRERSTWGVLAEWLEDPGPALSIAAARALVEIDATAALPLVMRQVVNRNDWPAARVASVLREAEPAVVAPLLSDAVAKAEPAMLPGLLRYMQAACPDEAGMTVGRLLRESTDDHVISTALQVLADPGELGTVRVLLHHPRWHVRVQAASALGRLGVAGDELKLADMLSDREWWVRYRAAQALVHLPFLSLGDLEAIKERQIDRYARDILDQVLAEARLQ